MYAIRGRAKTRLPAKQWSITIPPPRRFVVTTGAARHHGAANLARKKLEAKPRLNINLPFESFFPNPHITRRSIESTLFIAHFCSPTSPSAVISRRFARWIELFESDPGPDGEAGQKDLVVIYGSEYGRS